MYGNLTAVNLRTPKSRKQKKEEQRSIKKALSEKLEHGDFRLIERRIAQSALQEVQTNHKAKKLSYNTVRYSLDPDHILFSKRVISEAQKLISERTDNELETCQLLKKN